MIQSDLLYLTPVAKDDAALFLEIYTDQKLMQHVGPAFNQKSAMKLFNQCVNQITSHKPKYLFYVIKNKTDDEKLGIIGILWNQRGKNCVELGVMIAKSYISKGYAYKVMFLLMQHVFNHKLARSIVVYCNIKNVSANRISKALGFIDISVISIEKQQLQKIKWEITLEQFKNTTKR